MIVRLCCLLYARVNCGLRSVREILLIFNEVFEGYLGEIPSHTTIEDWIQKCGLDLNRKACKMFSSKNYAVVIDESITIGSQKLLLILGIPALHPGHALRQEDIQVLGMFVAASWNSEDVKNKLTLIMNSVGHNADYIVSDGGHNLVKAASLAGIPRHQDIGHSFGTTLESQYKENPEFNDFVTLMGKARLQYHLTPMAYLLPPNQRSISRFLNCFDWVDWAKKMLGVFGGLSQNEQEAFAFVKEHEALINELDQVMNCFRVVEARIKNEGLSFATCLQCKSFIYKTLLQSTSQRAMMVGTRMFLYLDEEVKLLNRKDDVHNLSSDIIESTFGIFKSRKSPNKLCGVTSFCLFIPVNASLSTEDLRKSFNFKEHLENVRLPEIKKWREKNLLTNWVVVRTATLNMAG